MRFVFYDTETTGTSKYYDQIHQFAAILTDDDLNEIERFELRCRLLPHVVPTAGAILVAGVSIDRLLDPTLPSHHEFITRIHDTLTRWSPATFVGYNSIGFDEPLLRQAFYQNLKPIYLTNTEGNTRQDMLPLVRAAHCLSPGTFSIPTKDDGTPAFKLDRLAPANGFADHNAHDAMGDVLATIHIARMIKERCPEVWKRSLVFCNRQGVENFLAENECFFVINTAKNDGTGHFAVPLTKPNDRQVIYLNLDVDLAELEAMTDEELGKWSRKSPRPVRRFRSNAVPHLLCLDDVPSHLLGEMTPRKAKTRARRFRESRQLQERIAAVLAAAESERETASNVEEQIYDGFYSNSDSRLVDQFNAAAWPERWLIAKQFEDKRLKQLARRLIYFEQPEALPPSQQATIAKKMAARMLGHEKTGDWTCIPSTLKEVRECWREASDAERALLKPLQKYLRERQKWAERQIKVSS